MPRRTPGDCPRYGYREIGRLNGGILKHAGDRAGRRRGIAGICASAMDSRILDAAMATDGVEHECCYGGPEKYANRHPGARQFIHVDGEVLINNSLVLHL